MTEELILRELKRGNFIVYDSEICEVVSLEYDDASDIVFNRFIIKKNLTESEQKVDIKDVSEKLTLIPLTEHIAQMCKFAYIEWNEDHPVYLWELPGNNLLHYYLHLFDNPSSNYLVQSTYLESDIRETNNYEMEFLHQLQNEIPLGEKQQSTLRVELEKSYRNILNEQKRFENRINKTFPLL